MRILNLIVVLFVLSAALVVAVIVWQGWTQANMSKDAYALTQEVQKLKLEKELEQIRREKQKDAIEYNLTKAKIQQNADIIQSGPVRSARILGSATLYAWPVLIVAGVAMGAGVFMYSRRQTTIQEVEKARHSELIQTGEAAAKAVEKAMPNLVRAAIAAIPRQAAVMPENVLDVQPEPEALRAFTGPVYYSQLVNDGDYEDGLIPYGRDIETGNLDQIGFKPLQSVVKLGKQGFGKSTATKIEILTALSLKYDYKHDVRLHLIDMHGGLEHALATEIQPVLPLFDTLLIGKDARGPKLLDFLQAQIDDAEHRQEAGIIDGTWDLIFFDEFTQTVENHEQGKEIEVKTKELLNLRKARKFLSIVVYDSSKGNNSGKGINPARLGISQLIFNTTEQQAAQLIGWNEYAKEAERLKEGQCLIKLPKRKGQDEIISICQVGMVTESDFMRYLPYIKNHAPQDAGDDEADDRTESQGVTPEAIEDEFTPERVKALMTESLSKTAKETGLPKSTLSNFLNGKGSLSDVQEDALRAFLMPDRKNVISLNERREALLSRA